MSVAIPVAERMLRRYFGEPLKPPTKYVIGFKTGTGLVLALDRTARETRLWFQPPAPPPSLKGVTLMSKAAKNSNLDGPLTPLSLPDVLRVEIDTEAALGRFLEWYGGPAASLPSASGAGLQPTAFQEAFARFQRLIAANDKGHAFTNFQEGIVAAWEGYKPRLREHARRILAPEAWTEAEIGSGTILRHAIDAIEIQDSRANLTNNLVFWQNRFGHANRDHRMLLEAVSDAGARRHLERLLFDLYRGDAGEGVTFDRLSALTGAKYPLLAYFFFLKDMDRFTPIQPTTFDRAFRNLGIDLVTVRNCSWDNYQRFNAALGEVRKELSLVDGLSKVRLIDAHSFCWMLEKLEDTGGQGNKTGRKDTGRVLGRREISIISMADSVENTVRNSNGQTVQRVMKNKELRMTRLALEQLLASMMDIQGDRCALTGIPFHFESKDADRDLLPSLDRIDSDGHYEAGNLQIVCRFVNSWKTDRDDGDFRRLLNLVRGVEVEE